MILGWFFQSQLTMEHEVNKWLQRWHWINAQATQHIHVLGTSYTKETHTHAH